MAFDPCEAEDDDEAGEPACDPDDVPADDDPEPEVDPLPDEVLLPAASLPDGTGAMVVDDEDELPR